MHFLQKHTWVLIVLALALSFLYPDPGLFLAPFVSYLLMLLMFLSLLKIRIRDVVMQLQHGKEILILLLIIHVGTPFCVFLLEPFLQLELYLGLLLISAMPSGISVVFLSKLFGGIPEKALPITAISHIITPVTVPLIVLLFAGREIEISAWHMTLTLIKLIGIPYLAAWIVRRSVFIEPLNKYSMVSSQILLFVLLIGLISPLVPLIIDNTHLLPMIIVVSIIMTACFFWGSYRIGKTRKDHITFGITGSFKNFTLATVVAVSLFTPLASLPVIVYAVTNNLLLVPLEIILRKYNK